MLTASRKPLRMSKTETYKCHLILWNEYLSGWNLGSLDMLTIEKLDREISIYNDHMHRLYDGTAPPSCYKDGLEEAEDIYEFQNKAGIRLECRQSPYDLAVIVEHDFADDELAVTTCAEYNSSHWALYYRQEPEELKVFITQPFHQHDTVSLGHRLFPTIARILVGMSAEGFVADAQTVL